MYGVGEVLTICQTKRKVGKRETHRTDIIVVGIPEVVTMAVMVTTALPSIKGTETGTGPEGGKLLLINSVLVI